MKDDFEQEFLDTWTPEGRRQWEEFHTAYKQHREARQRELAGVPPGAPPAAHK